MSVEMDNIAGADETFDCHEGGANENKFTGEVSSITMNDCCHPASQNTIVAIERVRALLEVVLDTLLRTHRLRTRK
jgi:hypothetical protein